MTIPPTCAVDPATDRPPAHPQPTPSPPPLPRRYVRRDAEGGELHSFERRLELEEELEKGLDSGADSFSQTEKKKGRGKTSGGDAPWLGQLVGGAWEIRPRHAMRALSHVLAELVRKGFVSELSSEKMGRGSTYYLLKNKYRCGTQFAPVRRRPQGAAREEEEEEEEEADEECDLELERAQNIARNQEILRQLGLA